MKYFAYGSNMCTNRLKSRVPSCEFHCVGELRGYVLKYHKRSTDGSGKSNVIPSGNSKDVVIGVIFTIDESEKSLLDEAEGQGYRETLVHINTAHGIVTVYMYTAAPNYIDDSLVPYTWYKDFVLEGAREHGLSTEYIQKIIDFPDKPDPDINRERENRKLFPCISLVSR